MTPRFKDAAGMFDAAMDALPDAVLLYSADGPGPGGLRIVAGNAPARELLHLNREDDRLVRGLRQPEILEAAEDTLRSGLSHDVAGEVGGAQPRFWRAWTSRLAMPGEPPIALLMLRDDTKAHRLERMRADFLANASHELRTPLASLNGFIETLRGHAKDDPAAREKFLAIMAAQSDRMRRLIDDLLSLSRIEMNEHLPPAEACDIEKAVREAIEGFAPLTAAKRVQISVLGLGEDRATAIADRDQIAQVIQNLVDNAIKHSPPGGTVSIAMAEDLPFETGEDALAAGARAREAGGGRVALLSPDRAHAQRYLRLAVCDQGPGIARQHLPRLAERFYRPPGQAIAPGTGLGLAIVKHIVNRHRGGLVVESAPGRGTLFLVYLPKAAHAPADNAETPAVTKGSQDRHIKAPLATKDG